MDKKVKTDIVLGKYECVSFPELNFSQIKSKIDTGARTSSIHSGNFHEEERNGKKILICTLLGERTKKYTFENYRIKKVKSSNGIEEERFAIKLKITLLNQEMNAEFTLSKRNNMAFPVLIGRNVLKKGFLVDVRKKFTHL